MKNRFPYLSLPMTLHRLMRWQPLVRLRKLNPVVVVFVISLAFLTTSLVFTHYQRSYNSDDLSWQAILLHWRPLSRDTVYLGASDNFVDKLPYFAFMGHLLSPGRKALFIESYVLAVTAFSLFYVSAIYFLKKVGSRLNYISLLPLVWLSSFGFSYSELYLTPMWRGVEVGLAFLTFMVVAMYFYDEIHPFGSAITKLATVLCVALAGFVAYSDPYYLIFALGPIGLFTVALVAMRTIRLRKGVAVLVALLGSLVFYKLSALCATRVLNFHMVATFPAQFVTVENIPANTMTALHGLLIIFGADFFGKVIGLHISLVTALINAVLLGFLIYKVLDVRKDILARPKATLPTLWVAFFAILGLFVFLVYTSSTLTDVSTYRYLFILVMSWILFLCALIGRTQRAEWRAVAGILLTIAIVLNIGTLIHGTVGYQEPGDLGGNVRNGLNYALIGAVMSKGLTKGYANYWQGNINTYLSQGKVSFLPTQCDAGKTIKDNWLIDASAFNKQATASFYLYDPDIPQPPTCTLDQITQQFGTPRTTLTVGDKLVFVYNYDILSKLQ